MAKSPSSVVDVRLQELRLTLDRIERKIDVVLDRLDGIEDQLAEEAKPEPEPRREPGTPVH